MPTISRARFFVSRAVMEQGGGVALLLLAVVVLAGCAASTALVLAEGTGGSGAASGEAVACGEQALPPGWPELSAGDAEALLAPFLRCASPGDYVALQERVDMPRVVEALDGWSAVRLGALGPIRADAADLLTRKRAAFLLEATERYGHYHAEVFALFVLHSAHDDEVRALLRLLARDKQLGQTLGLMPTVREELERRGLPLSAHAERAERPGDVLRGLGRAARDALATSQMSDGGRYSELSARWKQLLEPYQEAAHEVERALALRHFSPGSVAVGSFDAVTFGVPLGFYYLVLGTGQGVASLSRGQYEQATRELAPALLLGALYAGGRGPRVLSEARGALGTGLAEARLTALKEWVGRLEARLGVEGLRALARDIQASREAGHFVAVGGVDAALALREARGDVARAQAMMARARPGATGAPEGKSGAGASSGKGATVADDTARSTLERSGAAERSGGIASLVDEEVGLTRDVVEARLALMESEATGPRLPRDVVVLERQRPSLEAHPPGVEGNSRWREYVAYYEKRVGELEQGKAVEGPLRWAAYERMWGGFTRGLAFERFMVNLLREDAKLPRAQRRFLGDFDRPRIETYVGVKKQETGLRYADVLVIEEGELGGRPRRVESFSFKSRNLALLEEQELRVQMMEDAREALRKYGGALDIRRDILQPLFRGQREVPVQRVRLVYEGGVLKPNDEFVLNAILSATERKIPGVEVLFQ
ncbi:hypothetical protein D187_004722 [Cystobacter fuscus DSM 2262]|uniref:Lipoprotein n=1 Tax=Cystobacter fuscus (strain ATCC 25194 / DSM 2262 / NBRC 100088 / M29) TaxID=1242864 RepID=S9P662_CYSF2|nr:hypothetical protein [Cystobacter fuscus]EPX57702.1 hypothetical protein D187_004722 [Cystobacter fuscus DSM 2262]